MTTQRTILTDALLKDALSARADGPSVSSDLLDDVLSMVESTSQRWGWGIRLTRVGRPASITSPLARGSSAWPILILIAMVTLAAVGAAILSAGARADKLPPPFGPARNGVIVTVDAVTGTLLRVDPATGRSWSLGEVAYGPEFSNDGRRLLFFLPMTGRFHVMNADGSGVRELLPEGVGAAWAPDGDRIAIVHEGGNLWIHNVERDTSVQYDLGIDLGDVQWRPNHDQLNVLRGGPNLGSYLVNADGTGLRPVGAASVSAYGVWSPDGSTIAYDASDERIHLLNVDTGADRELALEGSEGTWEFPAAYSPDGTSLLTFRFTGECDRGVGSACHLFGFFVRPVVGEGPAVVLGSADHYWIGGPGGDAVFSPDGTQVLAFFGTPTSPPEAWLFDATTGQGEQVSWWPGTGWMTWQRLAP